MNSSEFPIKPKMKTLILVTLVSIIPLSAFARPSGYTCSVKWKTLKEDLPEKIVKFRKSTKVKVNKKIGLELTAVKNAVKVTVTEKSSMGSTVYNFQCSQSLNCSGERTRDIEDKKEVVKLDSGANGYIGTGSIDNREYFLYQNLPHNDFSYDYVLYFNDKEPMGLKVVCHE
jgi:hypothetical protein